MPKLSRVLAGSVLSALLAFAFATSASAAVFNRTDASLTVQIATLDPPTITGTGSASSVGGPGTGHTLPAGFLSLATAVTVPVSPTFAGLALISVPTGVTAGDGSFAPNGVMPVQGSALFFATGGTPAGAVPLQPVGGGGTAMFSVGPIVDVTLFGATWQGAGGASPVTLMAMSAALAIPITVTATAFDNRTAGGSGIVQLVAPATGAIGIVGSLPVFGVLQINYEVPEPAMMALGLAGGIVLVAAGRRKLLNRQ
ncbi:MAG: hypothetical protein ACR2PQ_02890 [Myxococcota bacterium]